MLGWLSQYVTHRVYYYVQCIILQLTTALRPEQILLGCAGKTAIATLGKIIRVYKFKTSHQSLAYQPIRDI
jgi:hypothetical protein